MLLISNIYAINRYVNFKGADTIGTVYGGTCRYSVTPAVVSSIKNGWDGVQRYIICVNV